MAGAAVPGRGGLAGQAVRVEMTLQESCSPRLQPHLFCDDPATRLKKKKINVVPCPPLPHKSYVHTHAVFRPGVLFIYKPIHARTSGLGPVLAPPGSGSASGLRLSWGRRGPLGESEGLCFLWLLWNSLSFLPPSHPSPPPW